MINATDLKNGTNFLFDDQPCRVVKYSHSKIGRGGANVKVSYRNLRTGGLEEKTFGGNAKFDEITTTKKPLQFLYQDADSAYFMDSETFEQIEMQLDILGDDIKYLKEGSCADVLFWEDQALSVELPPKITLEVSETVPGVKGNSATNIYKPATLENGLEVKVPLFIKVGDKVKVDTRTSEYIERVN